MHCALWPTFYVKSVDDFLLSFASHFSILCTGIDSEELLTQKVSSTCKNNSNASAMIWLSMSRAIPHLGLLQLLSCLQAEWGCGCKRESSIALLNPSVPHPPRKGAHSLTLIYLFLSILIILKMLPCKNLFLTIDRMFYSIKINFFIVRSEAHFFFTY